jgi:stage II sporulation protein D
MVRLRILFILVLTVFYSVVSAQVKIRIYANQSPETTVFSVNKGKYDINLYNGEIITAMKGEPVIVARLNGKLAVKKRNSEGFICDSLLFSGKTGDDSFSLLTGGNSAVKQFYFGDLQCFPDLGTLVLLNISDVERYIAGVVQAEGGTGNDLEYFKAQAIIARTYMYKYFDKHLNDRYNVCDNTHCQAFNGLSDDTLLNRAVLETKGQVILDKNNVLIMSAFHSNCGGQTSSSEDVWLSGQPYLRSVKDPYCITSRNATWRKSFPVRDWVSFLRKSGYNENAVDPKVFNFLQDSRLPDYRTGSFSLPLRTMRIDLNLRSTFFSVYSDGDSVILKGRGYGHGVGLCQEGAMVMALKGFNYREIIGFYYYGVLISDIKNAVILPSSSLYGRFLPVVTSTGR